MRTAVDMFVKATTLPPFTQLTCSFLEIVTALSFINISNSVACERKCLLYYADIYTPYGDPGLNLTWGPTTVRVSTQIALGLLDFDKFANQMCDQLPTCKESMR